MEMMDNTTVRRQDRLLDETRARELLAEGEYGVLSMVRPDGGAYGIPVNYVWDGEASVYLHGAPEGEKLRCLDAYPDVSFCVVGRTRVVSRSFTTAYESVVLRCKAERGLPAAERMRALELLIGKYCPDDVELGRGYAERSFHRTEIVCLRIRTMSGKCKRVKHE